MTSQYLAPFRPRRLGITVSTGGREGRGGQRWFGRGVGGIGLASFLSDVGHEVPTALLPSFLTSTLKAPASALGLIEGISDGLAGIARFGGGALADDPSRRRRVAVGGYTTTAVLSSAIGVAVAPWQAGVFRAAAWTARGLRVPARNALRASQLFMTDHGKTAATQLALFLYVGYNIAAAVISVPAGWHGDRHNPVRVLAVGAVVFAAGYLWFAVGAHQPLVLLPAFVLAGLGIGCGETAESAAVASLAPGQLRGSAFGLLATVQSAGNLIASTVAGVLWTAVSPEAAFIFLAAAMVIAAVLILTTRRQSAPIPEPSADAA